MKCPSENRENAEILLAYSSRTLNGSDTERLERHLHDCEACRGHLGGQVQVAVLLERHLHDCEACREFVRAQRAVWEALDSWEAEPVSEDFDRRLFQRIEREVSWWQRMRSHMSLLLGYRALSIAAVAALLVMAVWLDRPSPSRAPAQAIVHVEALQPDQVVEGLDEMEVLDQFNHLMKPDSSTTKM